MKFNCRSLMFAALVAMLVPSYTKASVCGATVTLPATCTGTLDAESGTPNSIVVEGFTLTTPSAVTIYTTSYGGGNNLDGTTSSPGGFQPNITLFDTTGFALATETGAFSPIANPDPSNGWKGDGYVYDPSVAAGSYYAILTDINNQVSAAFTGFGNTSVANFYTLFSGPGGNSFTDEQGNNRDGNYALNIEATSLASAVPEPATFSLILPALAVAFFVIRRRRSVTNQSL